jgi:hypothetical protein
LVRYALILPFHQPFLTEFNINERNLRDYISRLKRGKEKGRACHFMVQAMPAPYDLQIKATTRVAPTYIADTTSAEGASSSSKWSGRLANNR